jgi:ribose 5-phosphate isomerase A
MTIEDAKRAAAAKAAEFVENGMIVGLGTGSTAGYFIEILIDLCKKGLRIEAVASSRHSAEKARKGGIEVIDLNSAPRVDLTVDGADEIDPLKRMIKGGGGALLREKILAAASSEMVVIADDTKRVAKLGRGKLPLEILFYGSPSTRLKLEDLGYIGTWRMNDDDTLFLTDNGNLIFDISFDTPPPIPEEEHEKMRRIPGVIETGFFFNLAGRVLIGSPDGTVHLS